MMKMGVHVTSTVVQVMTKSQSRKPDHSPRSEQRARERELEVLQNAAIGAAVVDIALLAGTVIRSASLAFY